MNTYPADGPSQEAIDHFQATSNVVQIQARIYASESGARLISYGARLSRNLSDFCLLTSDF